MQTSLSIRIERDFFVQTQGKAKDYRHEHADLHAPAENVVHVSRFRRRLFRRTSRPFATIGRKHITPADFRKIIGCFQTELAHFHTRARTHTSVDFRKESSPFTALLYLPNRQTRRGEGFASSPPSPIRSLSSRFPPSFFGPSATPAKCSPKR